MASSIGRVSPSVEHELVRLHFRPLFSKMVFYFSGACIEGINQFFQFWRTSVVSYGITIEDYPLESVLMIRFRTKLYVNMYGYADPRREEIRILALPRRRFMMESRVRTLHPGRLASSCNFCGRMGRSLGPIQGTQSRHNNCPLR
jgi:hypothetical protein